MALTLGTNAYITLEQWKVNADNFSWNYSDYSDAAIEGAIIRSSVLFVDVSYTFKGSKVDSNQSMQLPTDVVTISDIEFAMCQTAWQELRGTLMVDPINISQSGSVTMTRDKIGSLEEEREYKEGSERTNTISTARIDELFRPYITFGSVGLQGVRV